MQFLASCGNQVTNLTTAPSRTELMIPHLGHFRIGYFTLQSRSGANGRDGDPIKSSIRVMTLIRVYPPHYQAVIYRRGLHHLYGNSAGYFFDYLQIDEHRIATYVKEKYSH